ncbi:MAG TPA: ABC transporter ATP-binding protein [Bacteroidales bacterium]|nr:ABC transporter ATP-binding protein [Bacteroidales bacterium]
MMKPGLLLKAEGLTIVFRNDGKEVVAVNGISFSLSEGEIMGIVGESGSGKSVTALSLLKLIPHPQGIISSKSLLLNTPNGEVDLERLDEKSMQQIRGKEISMIFQEPMTSLNPAFTCGMQVTEVLRRHLGMSRKQAREKALELFREVRLPRPEDILKSYPHQISGGQKQRVMIAMAIACNPRLLIADEPTTALDVSVQKTILELLLSLQQSRKMSILFITHDLNLVQGFAHRVMVMYKGKIVEEGPVEKIFRDPENPYTKGLIACRPDSTSRLRRLPTIDDFIHAKESGVNSAVISAAEREESHRLLYGRKPVVVVKALSKVFSSAGGPFSRKGKDFKALQEIFVQVYPGETLGIVGESGSGKTTLARVMIRLIPESSGNIYYKENDITHLNGKLLKRLRREIQIVFQDPYSSLNPRLTVGAAIMEPMLVHGLFSGPAERKDKAIELLESVGLHADHFHRYPHEFSGGQRQRICIARALAVQPELLLLDEAVSALDVSVQAQVLNLLNDLKHKFGLTYIFISHDLSVVRYMSDRVIVMKDGCIVETAEADTLYSHPQSDYTRMLLEASALKRK